MRVGEGSVLDILDWFHTNSPATVIGFFAAGDRRFNTFLEDVIRNSQAIDIVAGRRIDLFLFGAGTKLNVADFGRDVTVDALPLTPLTQLAAQPEVGRPVIKHISEVNSTSVDARRKLIKATALATHDLRDTLQLEGDDLPGLILLRKGARQKLVLRTRGHADTELLVALLRAIDRSLASAEQTDSVRVAVTDSALRQANAAIGKMELEERVIAKMERRLEVAAVGLLEILVKSDLPGIDNFAQLLREKDRNGVLSETLLDSFDASFRDRARIRLAEADAQTLLVRAERAGKARQIAKSRIAQYQRLLPPPGRLKEYISIQEGIDSELEGVISRFERAISYRILRSQVADFAKRSTQLLSNARKLLKLAVSIKTGGSSLLK